MENKIKEVIDGLVASIDKETEEEFSEIIEKLLNDKYLDWKDPDNTNCMYFYQSTRFIPNLLRRVYPEADNETINKVAFIYEHYDYLDNSIRPLVDMGYGCCADKTRWVIRQYLNKCLGKELGEIPHRHAKEHHYGHPDFGTMKNWMDYTEVLYKMYYKGFVPEVAECYNCLFNMKESVQTVMAEENHKINFFYAGLHDRIQNFLAEGKISAEESEVSKIEVIYLLTDDIINDTLTEEKILKAIKGE